MIKNIIKGVTLGEIKLIVLIIIGIAFMMILSSIYLKKVRERKDKERAAMTEIIESRRYKDCKCR